MSDIDEKFNKIKGIITTLADLIEEMDKQRNDELKELQKRVSSLEHNFARVTFKNN